MDLGYIGYLVLYWTGIHRIHGIPGSGSGAYRMPRNWCVSLVRCVSLPPTGACDSGGPTNRAGGPTGGEPTINQRMIGKMDVIQPLCGHGAWRVRNVVVEWLIFVA